MVDQSQIENVLGRLKSVEAELGDPNVLQDRKRYRAVLADYSFLKKLDSAWTMYQLAVDDGQDQELIRTSERDVTAALLKPDPFENRNAVWTPDGKGYYYLSEMDGTMNIYRADAIGAKGVQVTNYKKHPVRYLSISNDGTLCYSWDGDFYTMKQGASAHKLDIEILTDETEEYNPTYTTSGGAQSIAVSKDEKEVVFNVEGDIYTTVMDFATTKRITNTPEQEMQPTISPDGRTIVYAGERGGSWNLYSAVLVNKEDKNFTYATDIKEETLLSGKEPYVLPKFSPDGKKIAYLANKTEIRVYDVKTKQTNVVLPASYNFSYSDGDVNYEWSPDSRWIATTSIADGGWNNPDIVVASVDGKKVVNLTNSGYSDGHPRWALGGKAIVWHSDRAGYRSHGSWGAERDGYVMFLDREAWELAQMNKEDRGLYEMRQKAVADSTGKKDDSKNAKSDKKKKDEKTSNDKKEEAKTDSVKALKLDFDGCEDRVMRLTVNSTHLANSYLSPDGKKFYYMAAYEGGYDLWVHDLENGSTRILVKGLGNGSFIPDAKGENLYICAGTIRKLTLANGSTKNIEFRAERNEENAAERACIFDHCANQLLSRFCDVDYHGIDFVWF